MKKLLFTLASAFAALAANAQLSVSGDYRTMSNAAGIDGVYVFASLAGAEFSYNVAEESKITWKTYQTSPADAVELRTDNGAMSSSIEPEGQTGYILEVNDATVRTFWVFDYAAFKPQATLTDLTAATADFCSETLLRGTAQIASPDMNYFDRNGVEHALNPYTIYLTYNTLRPNETTFELEETKAEISLGAAKNGTNAIAESLENVFLDTEFSILVKDMDGEKTLAESQPFPVANLNVRPVVSLAGTLTIRGDNENENTNEADRGDVENHRVLEGSAPLDVRFEMFANDRVSEITWKIYKKGERDTLVRRNERVLNEEDFSRVGEYVVRVEGMAENRCVAADSVTVKIGDGSDEVFLEVPNVFTPNDDGINDEFRVAYRSILKFQMWVYNRWGRLVYSSKDPAKGWDGKIGGQKAATGVYFYVIEASGADGEKYNRKGSVNLLRGGY